MKIVGYLRVSTDQQVESGLGLEAQRVACENYAKKLGLKVEHFFSDEGLSGALPHEDRPGLTSAINILKKADILVIAKRDRLGRDPDDIGDITRSIKRKGARIISAAGEGTEQDDSASKFMRRVMDGAAEYERNIISDRIKAALKVKKNRGERIGHIPFGYKLAENNVNLVLNDVEYNVLKYMKELKVKGLSFRDIAVVLNKKSLLNREGAKWNHASLHRIMKNQNVLNK
jgi:DNA invertase Pin-like site-specific DNA recombinase